MVCTLAVGDALLKHGAAIVAHEHNSLAGNARRATLSIRKRSLRPRFQRIRETRNEMDTVFEAVNCVYVCVCVRPRLTGIRVLRQIDDTTEEERRRRGLKEFHYG